MQFDITYHGVDHEQYFPGVTCAFSSYTDKFVGIGDSPAEALENALEDLGQDERATWTIVDEVKAHHTARVIAEHQATAVEIEEARASAEASGDQDAEISLHCYVSIRVKW